MVDVDGYERAHEAFRRATADALVAGLSVDTLDRIIGRVVRDQEEDD